MRNNRAIILTDLGFGDAGKGSITDYLARTERVSTIVRFNGGPQAGHNVVAPDGRQHTFHQFSSASFVPHVNTHLSRFMLVSPFHLWEEAIELEAKGVQGILRNTSIDRSAKIITPYHEAANRIRETLRGNGRHGSCGLGIGETASDSIYVPDETLYAGDLGNAAVVIPKLEAVRTRKLAEFIVRRDEIVTGGGEQYLKTLEDTELTAVVNDFYETFKTYGPRIVPDDYISQLLLVETVVFEGAQGVLLDESFGFHPYTTWSNITNGNAETLLQEAGYEGEVTRLGLLRAYSTRHGAGPFPTEDASLTQKLIDPNNPANPWQQGFRVGHLDLVLARYALDIAGQIDGLVVSCLDQIEGFDDWSVSDSYIDSTGQTVKRLARSAHKDLVYQEALTNKLFTYKPHLVPAVDGPFNREHAPGYLKFIEAQLDRPVVLASFGPAADAKVPIR
jgi:adenylosuccinate synthase